MLAPLCTHIIQSIRERLVNFCLVSWTNSLEHYEDAYIILLSRSSLTAELDWIQFGSFKKKGYSPFHA